MPCITKNQAMSRRDHLYSTGTIDWVNLQPKIEEAKEAISKALAESHNPVIAFSGGKDSLVVLDLIRAARPDVAGVFCNTGNEYPETIEFVGTIDNVRWLVPRKSFWQCVREYGMPVAKQTAKRHGNQCCEWLKEKPAIEYYKDNEVDLVFTGLTMSESRNRMMMLMRMGNYYWHKKEKRFKCHPIYNWSEKEVWTYIKWLKLHYNPIYDLGIRRCGCRYCTAYLSWRGMSALYDSNDTKLMLRKLGQSNLDRFIEDG